jgi:predicted esterase YcpF (UPF0227 family)
VYLHGFISAPQSRKAVMLGDYVANYAADIAYRVPALHHRPAQAIAQAEAECAGVATADLTLVGSSLGGFYATVLAERLGCRAALLNPAVHPQAHFEKYLGAQKNMYTGRSSSSRASTSRSCAHSIRPRSRARNATGSSSRPATRFSTIARRSPATPAPCTR